jgi:hypothetical protein
LFELAVQNSRSSHDALMGEKTDNATLNSDQTNPLTDRPIAFTTNTNDENITTQNDRGKQLRLSVQGRWLANGGRPLCVIFMFFCNTGRPDWRFGCRKIVRCSTFIVVVVVYVD